MEWKRNKNIRETLGKETNLYAEERKRSLRYFRWMNPVPMLSLIMLISSLCLTTPRQVKKEAKTEHKKEINVMIKAICA
jgi:hypothetical protein